MENNFKCLTCGNEFYEHSFSIVFVEGEAAYKINNQFMKCPECKSCSVSSIEQKGEYDKIGFGMFRGKSDEEKKKCLKMRSDKHFKKKLSERKQYLDKHFTGSAKGLDFQDNS